MVFVSVLILTLFLCELVYFSGEYIALQEFGKRAGSDTCAETVLMLIVLLVFFNAI